VRSARRRARDKEMGFSELSPKSGSPSVKDSFMRFHRIIGHSAKSRYHSPLCHSYISGSAYNEYISWIRRNAGRGFANNPQNFSLSFPFVRFLSRIIGRKCCRYS